MSTGSLAAVEYSPSAKDSSKLLGGAIPADTKLSTQLCTTANQHMNHGDWRPGAVVLLAMLTGELVALAVINWALVYCWLLLLCPGMLYHMCALHRARSPQIISQSALSNDLVQLDGLKGQCSGVCIQSATKRSKGNGHALPLMPACHGLRKTYMRAQIVPKCVGRW